MIKGFDNTRWDHDPNVRLISVKSSIFASREVPDNLFVLQKKNTQVCVVQSTV